MFMSRKQFSREMPTLASSGVSQLHVFGCVQGEISRKSGSTVHKLRKGGSKGEAHYVKTFGVEKVEKHVERGNAMLCGCVRVKISFS